MRLAKEYLKYINDEDNSQKNIYGLTMILIIRERKKKLFLFFFFKEKKKNRKLMNFLIELCKNGKKKSW